MKNSHTTQHLYIITGGPGAGKTTLLNGLNHLGFITVPEEGRKIIKEQQNSQSAGLPWINKELFAELMFDASVKTYGKMAGISGDQPVFFDRGIIDTIGYLKLENLPVPKEMEIAARKMNYSRNVFILPPWKEIYKNDCERKQTLEVAADTFECMKETYREYGYHMIEVPKLTVEQRIRFILDTVKNNS